MVVKADLKKCKGSGSCVSVCPVNVLELKGKKVSVARPKDCLECGACVSACPNKALNL